LILYTIRITIEPLFSSFLSSKIELKQQNLQTAIMIAKKSALLLCLLTGSSAAFTGVNQPSPPSLLTKKTSSTVLFNGGGDAAPDLKPPPALYQGAVAAGTAKATAPWDKIFKLGVVSGCHIAFGAYLALTVGGACPGIAADNPGLQKMILGAFGLPFGLIMTLVTGGELFTGNTALVTAARMEGKIETKDLIKNWISSYAGNFVGSLILAYLAFKTGTLGSSPAAVAVATAKSNLAFDVAFVRGILCNWLVCMAVYMASGCTSLIGKMTAVWFPISAFVALGLDHSVANMFIIPLGMLRGADITIGQFLMKNLIPVTLGNIVGGAACVMAPFGSSFGGWFKKSD
jgi:formate/nitrite transporter